MPRVKICVSFRIIPGISVRLENLLRFEQIQMKFDPVYSLKIQSIKTKTIKIKSKQ